MNESKVLSNILLNVINRVTKNDGMNNLMLIKTLGMSFLKVISSLPEES